MYVFSIKLFSLVFSQWFFWIQIEAVDSPLDSNESSQYL